MKTVLVTGSAGFIGSHVSELLLSRGFKVIGVDNFDPFYDISVKRNNLSACIRHPKFFFYELDITEGFEALADEHIDMVVHLAAKAGVRPSILDPEAYIHSNVYGTQKLLEFMRVKDIRKMIFASSSSVYGNNTKLPFHESDCVDNTISPYAFTKKSCELLNHTYHSLFGFDIINLRFFTVYGPRQRPDLAIHKFVKNILNDLPITLYGDGNTARDYTFVEDTVNGVYSAMNYCFENTGVYQTVNLGNNTPVSLATLVDEIYQAFGKKPMIKYESMQPGDVDITFADISLAQNLFNYSPRTSLTSGLKSFIEWYRSVSVLQD